MTTLLSRKPSSGHCLIGPQEFDIFQNYAEIEPTAGTMESNVSRLRSPPVPHTGKANDTV